MEKKTWIDAHENEVFSDNSYVENCKQCKDCIFRDDGTAWSNDHRKSCCQMFQYPNMKPFRVINNKGICEYYNNGEDENEES